MQKPQQKQEKDLNQEKILLSAGQVYSLYYHDLFDYPLTLKDLKKWEAGQSLPPNQMRVPIVGYKNGFLYINGKALSVSKRLVRQKISLKKIKTAKSAAKVLGLIPTVKFVGITGSLAMMNANEDDDIDVIIITRKNTLWLTRAISFLFLKTFRISLRTAGNKKANDKLCMNMWLDESQLYIDKQNVYTAHEIAQITPLIDKNEMYKKFIGINSWIKGYWPNSVAVKSAISDSADHNMFFRMLDRLLSGINAFFFLVQYQYMKNKITKETISLKRALFHPIDLSETIPNYLNSQLQGS